MLDKKDIKIIIALKQNSSESIRDIAKKTGLRPSTVHQRIQKLVKNEVIEKFTLKLDNKAVEENFIVFVLIKTEKDIENRVFNNKHIKEVFGVTGEYDIILKLKFKDVEEFNNFIIKFRKDQGLRETMSMVATTTVKEDV